MLRNFARYHSEKIRAAYALALWRSRKEPKHLSDAALLLNSAIEQWESLAEKGRENYYHDLDFSSAGTVTRRGTWADLSPELMADRETLAGLLKAHHVEPRDTLSGVYQPGDLPVERCQISASFPASVRAGQALTIKAAVSSFGETGTAPVLHYRHTDQTEGLFHTLEMEWNGREYTSRIPAAYVSPQWDLQVYITIQGGGGCVMFPGVYHPVYPFPYHVITVKEGAS
jgi:hypothetical protein